MTDLSIHSLMQDAHTRDTHPLRFYRDWILEWRVNLRSAQKDVATTRAPQHPLKGRKSLAQNHASHETVCRRDKKGGRTIVTLDQLDNIFHFERKQNMANEGNL